MPFEHHSAGILDEEIIQSWYESFGRGYGVISGGVVTSDGTDLDNDYTELLTYDDTNGYTTTVAGKVTSDAGDSTNPRYDLIFWDTSAAAVAISKGTATAESASQPRPALAGIDSNDIPLSVVYVPAAAAVLLAANQFDRRPIVTAPIIKVRKSVDEALTTDTTLQNDDELLFSIPASTNWIADLVLHVDTPTAAGFKWTVTVPAAATLLVTGIAIGNATDVEGATSFISSTGPTISGNVFWNQISASGTAIAMAGQAPLPSAYIIHARIVVDNSTTAGTVNVQWAQNGSSGTTTVDRGSSLIAHMV